MFVICEVGEVKDDLDRTQAGSINSCNNICCKIVLSPSFSTLIKYERGLVNGSTRVFVL